MNALSGGNGRKHPETDNPSLLQRLRVWLRAALKPRQDGSLKDALEEVIEEHEGPAEERLAPEEKVMLHNVLSFSNLDVGDIMIPRTDIDAVPADISLPALKARLMAQRHTRIPVYDETLDHVQGFIHVKDLLPMLAGDAPFTTWWRRCASCCSSLRRCASSICS